MQQNTMQKTPLPSLLLKKSAANAATAAVLAAATIRTTATTNPSPINVGAPSHARRCIYGCDDNSVVLCRFPVHDRQRCDNWLKFFQVSEDIIKLHGLANLRVCLKHFHQQNQSQMAKTRMKTTPTRSAALTAEDIKKRLRLVNAGTAPGKETIHVTSNIMVPAPKRTNSISSATSSVSLASDTPSLHSEADFMVIPQNTTITTTTQQSATTKASTTSNDEEKPPQQSTPKTLNLQLGRQNMATLKNRKVFMITERCDDVQLENNGGDNNHQTASAQKRKMYLVMEETPAKNGSNYSVATKSCKNNVAGVGNPTKKLTLYTDKCDTALLTHKFEQILPEILNRINNNNHNNSNSNKRPSTISTVIAQQPLAKKIKENGPAPITDQSKQSPPTQQQQLPPLNLTAETARPPITLPPKKNRMKIINTANAAAAHNFCAATPVIMSTMNLELSTVEATPPLETMSPSPSPPPPVLMSQSQKNINLSADFLFLMKMLPQLEAITEPHKSYVKSCIEKIVSQQSSELCDEP